MSHLLIRHTIWLNGQECYMVSYPLGQRTPCWQGDQLIDHEGAMLLTQLQDLVNSAPRGKFGQDNLTFVLGAPMVRHTLLPWQDSLHSQDDWNSYAAALFAQQYGSDISNWRIQSSEAGYGQPRLAVAIDEVLYQTALDVARNGGLRLQGVEPLLAHTVNHYFRQIRDRDFALLILGKFYAHVAFCRDDQWQSVSCQPFIHPQHHDPAALQALLRDTAILSGQTVPDTVYLSSTETDAAMVDQHSDQMIWLGHPLPAFARQQVTR
ncbi:hypothetical protein [Chitinilyticum piscinae]|uniref:Uncharacterized protein n=1 Tax=Chitinilyticum piscinae TaxID=2866724 RepID=A0A8J7KBN1_9NEIS|nr:hypothetical protein [Chitinilyticum piscinae]MBE9610399.1 hypothetical protein [Chitinilyticum piscinae]